MTSNSWRKLPLSCVIRVNKYGAAGLNDGKIGYCPFIVSIMFEALVSGLRRRLAGRVGL